MKKGKYGIYLKAGMGLLIALLVIVIYHYGVRMATNNKVKQKSNVIIIDPGHPCT